MMVPELRFPDFLDAGEWEEKKLEIFLELLVVKYYLWIW
jgi:hypothetical protein